MPIAPFIASGRDETSVLGRPKSASTTYYTIPGAWFTGGSTLALTAGRDYYCPFHVSAPIIVDQLACEVTTGASGNLRMGLYRADRNQEPIGAPLTDSGDIAITVAIKTFAPSTPLYLARGRYLTVFNHSVNSTLRIARGSSGNEGLLTTFTNNASINDHFVTRAYAAFPTPGTAWDTVVGTSNGGNQYMVWLRVSTP